MKLRPFPQETEGQGPSEDVVVISFFAGDQYYYDKADELRAQCRTLGVDCDIAEMALPDDGPVDWADICRRKIAFYRDMLQKHRRPVLWVDVDSVLLRDPSGLARGDYDMGLFMRGFQYLPNYNPAVTARTFHPGYILFRPTPATMSFLDDCVEIEKTTPGKVTDDYILEEGLRSSEARMRFMIFSPRDVVKSANAPDQPDAYFQHGDSGNVREFRDHVEQHVPRGLEVNAQKAVLNEGISAAARLGRRWQVAAMLLRILDLDPDDFVAYARLLPVLEAAKEHDRLREMLRKGDRNPKLRPYALRYRMMQAYRNRNWEQADTHFNKLLATRNERLIAFAKSRRERFELNRRAEALGIAEDDRPKLFWWEEPYPGNLGDIINPYIVEKLSGIPPRFAPKGEGMCAIGSVIKFAGPGTPVWGSGTPRSDDVLTPDADYRAVRGPLTRDLVIQSGGTCPEVYGDAAWFLPILFNPPVEKTHKTGLILHFMHEDSQPDVGDEIRRIDIRRVGYDQIEAFLTEMLSCERIVSTSLHGVIIANAYGIPAIWAEMTHADKQVHGDGIKFKDYFLSVGIDEIAPLDLSGIGRIEDANLPDEMFRTVPKKIDLEALAGAAPFPILPEMQDAAKTFMKG